MKRLMTLFFCFLIIDGMAQLELVYPILNELNNLKQFTDTTGWDENYRTSEEEGQRGTQFNFDVEHPPNDAERIGCICMDGTTMDLKGTGACSGYGGVRYWVYQLKDGGELTFPTKRHHEHPEVLSEEEIANLASRAKKEKYGNAYSSSVDNFGWEELMAVMMICVTIAFITKTFLGRKNRDENLLD